MYDEDKDNLLNKNEENRLLIEKKDKCDKWDYLAAVGCGAIGGIIDIFFVGAPNESILGDWTDKRVNDFTMSFAKKMGWKPTEGKETNVKSAIGFLENRVPRKNGSKGFKVNYDQTSSVSTGNIFKMNTKNHHMMSLGHSPDPIGLFFSILNQFTNTSSFIANGQLITISTDEFELIGGNPIAKIFCGVTNWFGHLMSDIAGSSGAKGRGSGIVMPFYELFGLCKFGKFKVGDAKQDLATIATRAFESGYDFRFALTQSIPLIITELLIRLIWGIRQYFEYKKPIKECIPNSKHSNLRVMLLLGDGTLCLMDGMGAGFKSGGNFLVFFMRLNLVAWFRFVTLVLKEVFIRVGISDQLQKTVESFKRINIAMLEQLHELQSIDIELFKNETEEYNKIIDLFENVKSDQELNKMLRKIFEKMEFKLPWEGDFDEHMSNQNGTLVFE